MEQKTIKMNEEKEQKDVTKISYEELEKIANQLAASNRELYKKLASVNTELTFGTVEYMLKVIEINDSKGVNKFSEDFMKKTYSFVENVLSDIMAYVSPEKTKEDKNAAN